MSKLTDVQAQVITCTNCPLHADCRSPIPITMSHNAPRYVVIGEAPGQLEDRRGEPFVGPAGTFLRRSLRKAGLSPSDGAYMNAAACFPRLRGTPEAAEVAACRRNVFDQIRMVPNRPILVCGSIALTTLIPHANITWASGAPVKIHGELLFPVYHPSYILRTRMALEGWEKDLIHFRQLVDSTAGWQALRHTHCLYCNRGRATNSSTCLQHEQQFKQDSVPKFPKPIPPPAPTLF